MPGGKLRGGGRLTVGQQFKDSTFTIPTAHKEIVIIPPKFLDEIKALPEREMTFKEQVSERFLEQYTGLGITDTLVHSVKVGSFSFSLLCRDHNN